MSIRIVLFLGLLLLVIASPSSALINLLTNGDFSDDLSNGWTYSSTNVFRTDYYEPFFSPSGDCSYFAALVSNYDNFNPFLRQTVDLPDAPSLMLTVDFTLLTFEPSWGDDFRAQLEIGQLGQGWNSIFSHGSGSGIFSEYHPTNYPGLRYYSQYHFTYDLSAYRGTDDFILSFLVLGYNDGPADLNSAMLLDNVSITGAIPEPGTVSLMAMGLLLLGSRIRRKKK